MFKKNDFIDSFYAFLMLLFVFFLTGCQSQITNKTEDVIPVKVARVELSELFQSLDYSGNIKAEEEAIVYPKVSGKVIEKIKEDGSIIKKGETIAYIDRDEVGLKFEKAPVDSPIDGIVGRFYLGIGVNVTPQSALALVVNMDRVKVNLDIPEKYLPVVSLGQEAEITIDAYSQDQFGGKVTKISPVVDLTTRSAPLEITVDNPQHRLKSGMFAKVRLILKEHKNVPVILKEALIGKEPDLYVYIVENNKAILKKVTLGIRQGPYFQVQEGLKEGELVVIMGQQRLKDNVLVSVEMEEEK